MAIDRKVIDRDYQIDCVESLSAEVTRGRRKLLVEMATGTGKTRTAAAFIKRLFEAGIVTRVLFLVDRIALARQAEDAFTDHLRDYPCHVLRPGRGFDRAKRITIATLQTMIAEYRDLSPGYFDLVITDECHRSIYGKWSGALRHFDSIQLGLTATPCTADPDALPDAEDGLFVRDTLRFFELAEPTFRYTLRRAIEEGHLVPYRIYKALTVKTAAGDGFEVRRDELDWSAMDGRTRSEFEELFNASDTITVDPRALERRFTIPERNRAIVREFRDTHEKGFMGRDGVRRWPSWGKTIVFAVTRRHAETLAEMFDKITPCMENGKAALARDLTNGVGRGSTEFHILRPGHRVHGEYIYHFIRQPNFREEARRNFIGTAGQQRVPKSFLESTLVPLPSLDEQRPSVF